MKKSNSEIINKVKNVISENKANKAAKSYKSEAHNHSDSEKKFVYNDNLDDTLNKWIENNAEEIARDLIKEERKKIFK